MRRSSRRWISGRLLMRNKYTNNIMYLFKKLTNEKGQSDINYSQQGIPFYCNIETRRKSTTTPMSNVLMGVTEDIVKTTTQLDFEQYDRISFKNVPQNNANATEFSSIASVMEKPYNEKGNKYRTKRYKEYWLTLS